MERGVPTLGEIYRLASAGGDKQKQYMGYADKVQSPAAQLLLERLASTNDRTLTSYLSLLMTSGLTLWSNRPLIASRKQAISASGTFGGARRRPISSRPRMTKFVPSRRLCWCFFLIYLPAFMTICLVPMNRGG